MKKKLKIELFLKITLFATVKLHHSTYHRTPSGNPCEFSLPVLKHFFLSHKKIRDSKKLFVFYCPFKIMI